MSENVSMKIACVKHQITLFSIPKTLHAMFAYVVLLSIRPPQTSLVCELWFLLPFYNIPISRFLSLKDNLHILRLSFLVGVLLCFLSESPPVVESAFSPIFGIQDLLPILLFLKIPLCCFSAPFCCFCSPLCWKVLPFCWFGSPILLILLFLINKMVLGISKMSFAIQNVDSLFE